jgi:hypothetical protein
MRKTYEGREKGNIESKKVKYTLQKEQKLSKKKHKE